MPTSIVNPKHGDTVFGLNTVVGVAFTKRVVRIAELATSFVKFLGNRYHHLLVCSNNFPLDHV